MESVSERTHHFWISVPPIKDRDTEPHDPAQIKLFHSEILGAVANSLSVIDHYRGYVGAPNSEYGVEIEIRTFYPDTLSVPEGPRMTPRKMLPPIIYYHDLLELGGPERSEMGTLRVLLPRLAVGSQRVCAFTGRRRCRSVRCARNSPCSCSIPISAGEYLIRRSSVELRRLSISCLLGRPPCYLPWHRLNFLPDPHGHGSLRPIFGREGTFSASGKFLTWTWPVFKSWADWRVYAPLAVAGDRRGDNGGQRHGVVLARHHAVGSRASGAAGTSGRGDRWGAVIWPDRCAVQSRGLLRCCSGCLVAIVLVGWSAPCRPFWSA